MFEIVVGLFALALGWMCLDHVSRVRSLYSKEHSPYSLFHGEKPLMIFPSALGALFILDGLALLTLAAVERLRGANVIGRSVSSEIIVVLILVFVSIVTFVWLKRRARRNKRRAERQVPPEKRAQGLTSMRGQTAR